MSESTEPPGIEQIDTVWETLTADENEPLYEEIRAAVLGQIDEGCKRQINTGNYDATVTLASVFEWFKDAYLSDGSPFVEVILESDEVFIETIEYDREQLGHLVFDRLIAELEEADEILYVYDRQRVRSQVAEMARYFALIRQRLDKDGGTAIEYSPNLVKMVKMAVLDRKQPIVDPDRSSRFGPTLRQIGRHLKAEQFRPATELEEMLGDEWESTVKETVDLMGEFFEDGLPDEFESLADYQARAFVKLYLDAITESAATLDAIIDWENDLEPDKELAADDELAHVITASTGGGKTEAFLFPILAYCHTAWRAGLEGNKAVLTYPRQDLCNNQFERLVDYAFTINKLLGKEQANFGEAPISVGIQHGGRSDVEIECPFCDDETTMAATEYGDGQHFACTRHEEDHVLEWATVKRSNPADVIITTQDSLHIRLMDRYGKSAFWESPYPPKFVVLDEVHVYTEQSGMHVSNVVRRFKRALEHRNAQQQPTLVASSATIDEAQDFTRRIFNTDAAALHTPSNGETEDTGSEYMIFVKATEPRDVAIPVGDSVFKPQEEWDDLERTTVSNLSCMIQIAFAFQHTVRKERAGSRPDLNVNKDRILGFVDSIDSVSRLGSSIDDAEHNRQLYALRQPDAFLRGERKNPDCPSEQFRQGTDDKFDETAVCEHVIPNKHLNECQVYEAGECWWTMRDPTMDLRPTKMAIHKSGRRQRPGDDDHSDPGDDWKQMIATSALEVGFDHPSIIGTFQYRAPTSVPGFIQRKGRGGRDPEDKPVTVVVLGSTSKDSFYFHHSERLSTDYEDYLEVPLDEGNQFVRAEHMTAAIFDYFNVHDGVNAERIYRGTGSGRKGPDIQHLAAEISQRSDDLREWLRTGFDESSETAEEVIGELNEYIESVDQPLVPGEDDTSFWEAFRKAVQEADSTGRSSHIDDLAQSLRRKVSEEER